MRATILSGSFDPLHPGHLGLLRVAAEMTGLPPVFELPMVNPDKGWLTPAEVERRLAQFTMHTVVLTRLAFFSQKAPVLPGSVFVVGFDIARRILDPRDHGGEAAMRVDLRAIADAGCRFLVAGRVEGGQFRTLGDLALPIGGAPLFEAIPEARFRVDLSSTELRARQGRGT